MAGRHRRCGGGSLPAEERRPRRVRQDLGRQGTSRRFAGEAESRMARRQGVHQGDRRRDGGRQSRALRVDDPEGAAARQDSDRLSAQPARHDRRRPLLHPRPAGRAGLYAARLGRARARDRAGLFHRPQHADAPRLPRGRSVGGFPRSRGADRGPEAQESRPANGDRAPLTSGPSVSWPRRRSGEARP